MTFTVRSTVVSVAADPGWGLVARADFKSELGVIGTVDDSFIDRLIAQATAAIASHCNRTFAPRTLIDLIVPGGDPYPWQVPPAAGPLQLSAFPVLGAVGCVSAGVSLVEGLDLATDPALGRLFRLDPGGRYAAWPAVAVTATYRTGFDTPPPDLADAATRLVKARWFARARDPGLRSESIPEVISRAFWFGTGPGSNGALPPDVEGLLAPWRVPVTA